ncbi:MAG: class I SAM-dependent methyltransferase, partial [Oscillospiraceae bacterium]
MTANPLERAFEWSPDKVRWYRDACEYSENDRNARIADAVMGQLPTFPSVCDIGCGIGCLSLELAKQASRMLALELNTYALSVLISQVNDDQITNIETMQGDVATLPPP